MAGCLESQSALCIDAKPTARRAGTNTSRSLVSVYQLDAAPFLSALLFVVFCVPFSLGKKVPDMFLQSLLQSCFPRRKQHDPPILDSSLPSAYTTRVPIARVNKRKMLFLRDRLGQCTVVQGNHYYTISTPRQLEEVSGIISFRQQDKKALLTACLAGGKEIFLS
jgi:hypothetical protein